MSELVAIILAAGKGTRMRSKYPKVLHKVGGKPMLQHVIDAASAAGADKKVVIVGHEAELVEAMVGNQGTIALQAQQQNTDPITYTDLYEWGLSGSANASERRRTFLRILGLPPRLSKKEIIQVLNTLYTRAALQAQLEAMK